MNELDGGLDGGLPIYILDDETICLTKKNIDHTEFWQQEVASIVSFRYKVDLNEILNLPYCQRRARVVGNNFYCGDKVSKSTFKKIELLLNKKLKFVYDEHETRCEISTAEFNGLKK